VGLVVLSAVVLCVLLLRKYKSMSFMFTGWLDAKQIPLNKAGKQAMALEVPK
jgi:hypothetical protein